VVYYRSIRGLVLAQGQRVAATSRNIESMQPFGSVECPVGKPVAMKKLYVGFLLLLWVTACEKDMDARLRLHPSEETVIRSSISYAECMGYCTGELTVTRSVCVFKRISNNGQKVQTQVWHTRPDVWNRLVARLDTHQLAALPVRKGCPGCGDEGAEWLGVQHSGRYFQTSFSSLDTIPQIAPLLEELHRMYLPARR
jgi:hypothetical protein